MEPIQLYLKIGGLIRDRRKAHQLTQQKLAQQIGMSRASLANIEAGRQQLSVHQLCSIATTLELEPTELLPPRASGLNENLVDIARLPDDLTDAQRQQLLKLIQSAESEL